MFRHRTIIRIWLVVLIGLGSSLEPATAQSGWFDRMTRQLEGWAGRLSPPSPPKRWRVRGARPVVDAPLPQKKPSLFEAPALKPALPPDDGPPVLLAPLTAVAPLATVFKPGPLSEAHTADRSGGEPPGPEHTTVLVPSGSSTSVMDLSNLDALVRSVAPPVGTVFLIETPLAPPPAAKPRPPRVPSTAPEFRLAALSPQSRGICRNTAAGLAIYEARSPIAKGVCSVARPVLLKAIGTDQVRVSPRATVNCNMTAALVKWADNVVAPAARRHLGVQVVSVRNFASYACRRRNNSKRGRISEHATANALDIGVFHLANGGEVSVEQNWRGGGAKQAFLREVHKKSCGVFKTVLGPNSDRHHRTHFHFDLAKRRSTYCR